MARFFGDFFRERLESFSVKRLICFSFHGTIHCYVCCHTLEHAVYLGIFHSTQATEGSLVNNLPIGTHT